MNRSMFSLWLVSCFILLLSPGVTAAGYSKMCPLSESPLVHLQYDPVADQFVLLDDSKDKEDGGRNLQDEIIQFGKHLSSHTFRGARQRLMQSRKAIYTARRCPCDSSGTVYCLVDTAISTSLPDTCGVPQGSLFTLNSPYNHNNVGVYFNDTKDNNSTIECFELASQTVFIRNAWPVVVLWYGALIIFFLATANGKYAQMCLFNTCCPMFRINERYVDRVLRREEEMRSRLRAAAVRANDGPGRFLRRSHGVRVRRNLADDAEEEEMNDPFRRWMEAIETFGMLNAREVEPQQQMEYVLRTRKFDASRERKRRNNVSPRSTSVNETVSSSLENESSSSALTPIKTRIHRDEEAGPSVPDTPETVATNASEGVDSIASDEVAETMNEQPSDYPLNSDNSDEQQAIDVDEESGNTSQHNHESSEPDDETFDCTICLMEVNDGEQVGVLSCSHIFHVDCLREWIIRRNACPLCQTEISTPRPVEGESPRVSSSSEESAVAERDAEITLADYDYEVRDLRPRPYLITSALDRRDPMPDIMTSLSRRSRREYNRGRTQRQQREDPFSFAGW